MNSMRGQLLTLAVCGLSMTAVVLAQDEVRTINRAAVEGTLKIEFADANKASQLLQTEDDFTAGLSRFDFQVRLQTKEDVGLADLKKRIAISTRELTDEETRKITASAERMRKRCEGFRLPWPDTIWLAKTNGREDADAAYTRGTTIVLPEKVLKQGDDKFDRLLVHEAFHVLSRNNPEFREHMYAVIGFHLCDDIPLPQSLVNRKISNPDAPRINCYQNIRQGKEEIAVTPVLFSRNDFDPRLTPDLFKSMEFKLMRLQKTDGGWRAAEKSGQLLIDPKEAADFHSQIGRNTGYIIHPDEILADNFVHLIMADEKLKSPEIVEGMKNVVGK
jgi:hypothetical protein